MDPFEITYAIAKQVPSIEELAQFETSYGRLQFRGRDAERIASLVQNILEEKQLHGAKRSPAIGYGAGGLAFNALRAANVARMPEFKNKHGELAHSKADGSDWSPAQWFQAVIGEIGEYANVRKKFERGDMDSATFKSEASDELADAITYMDILATQIGISLGSAVIKKFNEVSLRVGSGVRLGSAGCYNLNHDLINQQAINPCI